jgi:hypothetical protein
MRKIRLSPNFIFFLTVGAVLGAILLLSIVYIRAGNSMEGRFRERAKILRLVSQMRVNLALASEAEKSAAVAESDQASMTYADQARASTVLVESAGRELAALVRSSGTDTQKKLFEGFSRTFAEFKLIEVELLDLAVRNTNTKAYKLAFGPVAEILHDLDAALNRLVAANKGTSSATAVSMQALKVKVGALRIQVLLAPHIAEANDWKVDQLEEVMAQQDREVFDSLDRLGRIDRLKDRPDMDAAMASYGKFTAIRKNILALSRENTNIRSLAISLNKQRKVDTLCQDALNALQLSFTRQEGYNPRSIY